MEFETTILHSLLASWKTTKYNASFGQHHDRQIKLKATCKTTTWSLGIWWKHQERLQNLLQAESESIMEVYSASFGQHHAGEISEHIMEIYNVSFGYRLKASWKATILWTWVECFTEGFNTFIMPAGSAMMGKLADGIMGDCNTSFGNMLHK